MRTPVYWLFVLWMTTRSAAYTIVLVYFIPLMEWKGLTFLGAGMVLSWFNFMNIVAHFIMGWIADQTNKMRLVAWCMGLSLVATLILMWSDTVWGLLLFAALFTVLDASIPVIWAAVGDYFGRRRFGTIRGNMSFFYMWGSVLGPYLAGTIVDHFNSHTYVLWLLLGLVGACRSYDGPADRTLDPGGRAPRLTVRRRLHKLQPPCFSEAGPSTPLRYACPELVEGLRTNGWESIVPVRPERSEAESKDTN